MQAPGLIVRFEVETNVRYLNLKPASQAGVQFNPFAVLHGHHGLAGFYSPPENYRGKNSR